MLSNLNICFIKYLFYFIVVLHLSATKIFVSSANKMNLPRLVDLYISLIYTINNKGPSTEPCGTQNSTGSLLDFSPSAETYCNLLVK